ncbi:MAG: hypothetical protein O3A84_11395, partial [Proteobacteria bacterium]|nr:hypothetical protein [Pseudomonadota bacterium]
MMDITTPNTEERGNTTAADLAGRITAARDAEGDLIISTDDGQEVLIRNYSDPTTNIEIILPDDSRIDGMTAATWMAQIGAVIAKGGIEPNQTSELETSLRPASVKLDSTVLDEDIADDRAHKDAIAEFETAAGYDEGKYQPAPDLPADDQSDFGQRSAESLSRVFASREELGRPANDSDT